MQQRHRRRVSYRGAAAMTDRAAATFLPFISHLTCRDDRARDAPIVQTVIAFISRDSPRNSARTTLAVGPRSFVITRSHCARVRRSQHRSCTSKPCRIWRCGSLVNATSKLCFGRSLRASYQQAGIALARVWIVKPGDICRSCRMRASCPDQTSCLHLAASAGIVSDRRILVAD